MLLCAGALAFFFGRGGTSDSLSDGVQVEGARDDELAVAEPTKAPVLATVAKTVRVEPTIAPSTFIATTPTPEPTATPVPTATAEPTTAPAPTAAPADQGTGSGDGGGADQGGADQDDGGDQARLSADEPAPTAAPEPTQEPTAEPTAEPVQEPTAEPVQEPTPEIVATATPVAAAIADPTAVPTTAVPATTAPATTVPAPTAVPYTPLSFQPGTYYVDANDGLVVREQPGGDSIAVLPGGTAVAATGQAAETTRLWVEISSPMAGWVAAEFLAVAPVPTPTPHAVVSTVGGPTADQMAALANCESGGNYAINTGNGYYGAYQFAQSTWDSVAAQFYPQLVGVVPSNASAADQDAMMIALHSTQGFAPWPGCRASLGLP